MANVLFPLGGGPLIIDGAPNGTNTYILGDASQGFVGTFAIQVYERVAGTISIVVEGRSRLGVGTATVPPLEPIPYLPLHLNGTVATYGTGSSVAITDNSLILVPATGLDVALNVTYTDGEWDIYVTPHVGAAA